MKSGTFTTICLAILYRKICAEILHTNSVNFLKGQCHEIVDLCFPLKTFLMNSCTKLLVFAKIFNCKVRHLRGCVVNEYADTLFSQISSRKEKISLNHFSLLVLGTGRVFFKGRDSGATVSLICFLCVTPPSSLALDCI